MKANQRVPLNKYEGVTDRNFTSYNPQVVRDDVFQLGIDATYKSNRLAVLRSSSRSHRRLAEREPRLGLFAAADHQRRGIQRPGLQSAFPAHDQRRRHDEGVRGLPRFQGERQQRMARVAARLRHRHGEFLRPLRLRRRRQGRPRRGGLDRAGRTAGRHRQPFAKARLSRQLQEARRGKPRRTQGSRITRTANEILDLQLRGEYLYTANGADGFEVFDVANIDQKGFFRAHHHRAGFAARPAHLRPHQIRHERHAAQHARRGPAALRTSRKIRSSPSARFTRGCSSPTARKGW